MFQADVRSADARDRCGRGPPSAAGRRRDDPWRAVQAGRLVSIRAAKGAGCGVWWRTSPMLAPMLVFASAPDGCAPRRHRVRDARALDAGIRRCGHADRAPRVLGRRAERRRSAKRGGIPGRDDHRALLRAVGDQRRPRGPSGAGSHSHRQALRDRCRRASVAPVLRGATGHGRLRDWCRRCDFGAALPSLR